MQKIKNFISSLFGSNRTGDEKTHRLQKMDQPAGGKSYRSQGTDRLFYIPNTANQVESRLIGLTQSPVWNWECFRGVLICLATLGEGRYIPASRRPNCIFLDGLRAIVAELRQMSEERQGRETSRVVFVDRERACLVVSGKTRIGSISRGIIDATPELGRGVAQVPVLSIHVHPSQSVAVGLSEIDYVSFLSDPRQIVMMISFQSEVLFAMKTSVTLKAIDPNTAQHWIATTQEDIIKIWSGLRLSQPLLAFNKAVCLEFGMTLYQSTNRNMNIARRTEVTDI